MEGVEVTLVGLGTVFRRGKVLPLPDPDVIHCVVRGKQSVIHLFVIPAADLILQDECGLLTGDAGKTFTKKQRQQARDFVQTLQNINKAPSKIEPLASIANL